jgi:hypothetical protein
MPAPTFTFTPEQIAKSYTSALDSVALINTLVAKPTKTAEEIATIKRNVDHLKIIVARTYWTTEDLTPFNTAITLGTV